MVGERHPLIRVITWTPWCLAGVAVAALAWTAIVPWDMSTVDVAGNRIPGRGDGPTGQRIALALAVVLTVALLVDGLRARARPVVLAAAGSATWALLFAWRSAASRVGGANLWPIGFVLLIAPAAVLGPFLVARISAWRTSRRTHR